MTEQLEHYMQKVGSVKPLLTGIANKIKQIPGCLKVFAYGSFAENFNDDNYKIKDLDIVVSTPFHSADFLAIESGEYSPLKIAANELEDWGYNPKVVAFTKQYLKIKDCSLDHWVTTGDNKILHWGIIPDNMDEWAEIKTKAEKFAISTTGYNRIKVSSQKNNIQSQWYKAYTHSINQAIKIKKYSEGWFPSDHKATDITDKCIEL